MGEEKSGVAALIGVLGGMGPLATMRFLENLVPFFSGVPDREYPRIFVDFHTKLPSRSAFAVTRKDSPVPGILQALESLERLGCDLVCMPCNSAESILLGASVHLPQNYVSIIESTAQACADLCGSYGISGPVLVLGGRATYIEDRYSLALGRHGISTRFPVESEQQSVESMIESVKRRGYTSTLAEVRDFVQEQMEAAACDAVVLACTELDLATPRLQSGLAISSSHCLAEAVVFRENPNLTLEG